MLSLPQADRLVLGSDLKCSESSCSAPDPCPSDPHASKRDCRLCPQRAFGLSAWVVLNSEQAPYRRGRKMKEARQMTPMRVALRVPEIGRAQRLNSSHRCISYAVFCLKKK